VGLPACRTGSYVMKMTLTRLRRAGSLALLLSLVGGGLGLPVFDAVVFHTPGRGNPPERTLAAPGSVAGHAQVCILGRIAPQSRGLPAPSAQLVIVAVERPSEPYLPAAMPASQSRPTLQLSRAPPVSPA
jgi:hypothetical protein